LRDKMNNVYCVTDKLLELCGDAEIEVPYKRREMTKKMEGIWWAWENKDGD